MVLSKRVGETLKTAREERKLSVRDVARETNIAAKYVEALEDEDFSQFPGDTYAMGFLRNYVEFLNMDVEHILNLYRGQQIDQSPAPVKELTRQTSKINFQMPRLDQRVILPLLAGLTTILIVFLFASDVIELPSFTSGGSTDVALNSQCNDREIQDFNLPSAGSGSRGVFLDDKSTLRFAADQHRIKLCLLEVKRSSGNASQARLSLFIDGDTVHNFSIKEREEYVISSRIKGLKGLARNIILRPTALADYTAQIEFSSQNLKVSTNTNNNPEQNNNANPDETNTSDSTTPNKDAGTGLIQVTLEFIQPSYMNWVQDGQYFTGKTWPAGKTMTLEANNRLEIKIGNGAGVRIRRDGVRARLAGRPAQIVTLTYSMVPDPLDPGIKKIKESIR